ncbi:ATP-dependent zinc metalloprotease FtsH [Flammeovirga yaeyamensis]|uniref:ATP-dependent zinc metalloprotease FtsH n=1 Tax=Flammeovirga yaeyamensis TaxID=367791 RepID=A0AAX1MXL1_9BACT|nr:ATP-dependent zinc metalloprotease FtsH [Flammeovirga yaeyamensis]MBB3696443.1 cell division protease FtsH [Flammeovirga yaeyamensis]NMF35122.1 ATP-dependent zinc metalloprotease FtsH [Flammeovirga yaeyamensis]QWG00058.1 ATP-dependent zinc metalloprotease FtsH [Flammeovirga yaeyamensis]
MKNTTKFSIWYFLSILGGMLFLETLFFSGPNMKEMSYNDFRENLDKGKIEQIVISDEKIYGKVKKEEDSTEIDQQLQKVEAQEAAEAEGDTATANTRSGLWHLNPEGKSTPWSMRLNYEKRKEELARQFYVIKLDDKDLVHDLQVKGIDYKGVIENDWLGNFISNWVVPFLILIFIWGFFMRRMTKGGGMGGGGNNYLNVGKSKAKIYASDAEHLHDFNDVAGCDEAKQELAEVVDFLKNSEKYTDLGAKIPKGILLVGPPGTGKTLLAKAVAGEAGVHFYALSGSDFVEMFVGVGAARVRDLFTQAKAKSPCIIFIDELDAIGKSRGSNGMSGNDERENTLNQLLVEMDGFAADQTVIVLGATNRPEILDKALLRPGRFDRQVQVDRPDLNGRLMILKVHSGKIKLGDNVNLEEIAAQTAGFVGADLANLCNEAALLAAREGKTEVHHHHFFDAFERVVAGLEKKNAVINEAEKRTVAYHEAGHAIVGHFTKGADPVRKVSIVPRGSGALGYVLQAPTEDRFLMSKEELIGKIKGLLGGRAAEEIKFGVVSTGASNDLEKVASIVRSMLTVYGMSDHFPNLSLQKEGQNNFLGNGGQSIRRSEDLEKQIDQESLAIIAKCYEETKEFLKERNDDLEKLAGILLEKEILDESDVNRILGPRLVEHD